jgi:hypothetical protein
MLSIIRNQKNINNELTTHNHHRAKVQNTNTIKRWQGCGTTVTVIDDGTAKWCSQFEDGLAASYKIKHALTLRPINRSLVFT